MTTDIRDLILDDSDENMDKTAEQESNTTDYSGHIKIAEKLEALSEEDTIKGDLLKVAIYQEVLEELSKGDNNDK